MKSPARKSNSPSARRLPCGRERPAESLSEQSDQERTQHLKDYLSKHGLKFTEQRWKIARFICSASGHWTAQEIVDRVRKQDPSIGAATVYRTLKVLCDAALLRESFADESGVLRYEAFHPGHHDHMVCLDCGEVFEFHDETIEVKQDVLSRDLGFDIQAHRHVLFGRCRFKKKGKALVRGVVARGAEA